MTLLSGLVIISSLTENCLGILIELCKLHLQVIYADHSPLGRSPFIASVLDETCSSGYQCHEKFKKNFVDVGISS